MDRILVLVDEDRTRALLEQWLSVQYPVHLADSVHNLDGSFELCVVDRLALRRLGPRLESWRARHEPALLPLLLVTSRRAIPEITEHVWQLVDELIVSPLDSIELQARIARLLHTRQLSLELRHNRETLIRIRKAIESTSDAISVADMDGTALYHNQAFFDLYGYAVNDLNLRGIAQTLFVHPDVAENIFASARAGSSWSGEVILRRKGGQLMPTLLRADSIEDDSGRRIGLVMVYTDKNRIREVDASERPQRILAEALRDIVAAVNSTLELDQVLMLILAYVGRVVPFDAASIMLVNAGEAYVAAHVGCESGDLNQRVPVRDLPILAHMAVSGHPVVI
ncbi:MAG: PAS domain S-box protein, partial [Anaerolineae bacterium]|nr:PAS domain S-box protein [Anaerolineae bacterium]